MYESWFGFREAPFRLTPATRGFYSNASYERACTMLLYGLRERKGLLVLTGEVGTGKTTVLRRVMDQVEPDTRFVLVFNATWNFDELLEFICDELGLPTKPGRVARIQELNGFLLGQARAGGTTALLIDEAHGLTDDALEQIRLLSNLETSSEKLLQIVLVGQPELEARLGTPQLRQLAQRIAVRCRLDPLRPSQVQAFVKSRLTAAGYQGQELFGERALLRIASDSRGIPRLINVIADNALLHCFARSRRKVTAEVVDEVVQQLRIPTPAAEGTAPAEAVFGRTLRTVEGRFDPDELHPAGRTPRWLRPGTTLLVALVGVALLAGIVLRYGPVPNPLRKLLPRIDVAPAAEASASRFPRTERSTSMALDGGESESFRGAQSRYIPASAVGVTDDTPPSATNEDNGISRIRATVPEPHPHQGDTGSVPVSVSSDAAKGTGTPRKPSAAIRPKTVAPQNPRPGDRHSEKDTRQATPDRQPGSRSPAMILLRNPPWVFGQERPSPHH